MEFSNGSRDFCISSPIAPRCAGFCDSSAATLITLGYRYDAAGNRLAQNADTVRTTYAYDVANRLRWEDKAGRTTYLYDAAGNQVSKIVAAANRETRLSDYEQRTSSVVQPNGDRTTYTVDGDLKRVAERRPTGSTTLVYDGENVLAEIDELGVTKARYLDRPNAGIQGGGG